MIPPKVVDWVVEKISQQMDHNSFTRDLILNNLEHRSDLIINAIKQQQMVQFGFAEVMAKPGEFTDCILTLSDKNEYMPIIDGLLKRWEKELAIV
jgi:hypothetical protein